MKLAIIDCETTGLDPYLHEIIEIGCVICNKETLEIEESFSLKIKPIHPHTGQAKAFEVNGYNEKDWEDGMRLYDAMAILSEKTKGCTLTAFNICFDDRFITRAFQSTGTVNNMTYHRFDVLTLAVFSIPDLPVYSLRLVCEALGIKPEPKIHRAINGALCCWEVLNTLTHETTF